ncbi:hypothetical protein DFQ26_007031 [Actinomortierella ambigua]|nr:hypothetical protein DFQ26_007031 [Actinomortierella ambigua]
MVLQQRTRQNFQATDQAVPYSPVWDELVSPFDRKDPLVEAWYTFVTGAKHEQQQSGRTTTQQQTAALKKLEQGLKPQLQQNDQLLQRRDFQQSFATFLALLYFGAIKLATRRQILGLLQQLLPIFHEDVDSQDGVIAQALRSVVLNELLHIGDLRRTVIDMAIHQRALCLYSTLDYQLGRTVVRTVLEPILTALANQLHDLTVLTNVQVSRDAISAEATESMLNLEYTLKLILAFISRLIEGDSTLTSTLIASPTEPLKPFLRQILLDSMAISSSPVYQREVTLISGMIFTSLIDLTSPTFEQSRQRIVALLFGGNGCDVSFFPSVPYTLVALKDGWRTRDDQKCGMTEDDAGMYMLGIVRGLLTNIRKEVLVAPIGMPEWFAPEVFGSVSNERLVLHELLFHAIAYLCANAKDASSKINAFETMGHWLQQTNLHLSDTSSTSTATKQALVDCVTAEAQETLVGYVLGYWEDPIETVQHKVKNILELLLDTVYMKARFSGIHTTPAFVTNLLERILMADVHRKSKYPILAILTNRVTIQEIQAIQPDALARCTEALEHLPIVTGAALAVNTLIASAWKECLEQDASGLGVLATPAVSSKKSSKKKASDGDESSAAASVETKNRRLKAIQPWLNFWLKPLASAMTTDNDMIRKQIGHFVLGSTLAICPEAFWCLMEVLDDRHGRFSGYVVDEKCRLSAMVLSIKTARSLDLVSSEDYASQDGPQSAGSSSAKIDIDILTKAMFHQSDDIRIDVLGILCESRRPTAPVNTIEFELLQKFLPLNMNVVVPDFRQKMCTSLAKLLSRVRSNVYNLSRDIKRVQASLAKKTLNEADGAALIHDCETRVEEAKSFLHWLLDHLFLSIYPGASYQRVSTSLRLLGILIKMFGIDSTPLPTGAKAGETVEFPFQLPIASAEHISTLLTCLTHPFDHCREQSLEILMSIRAPFSGYSTLDEVSKLVRWGLNRVESTRAGVSDSGGLILKVVFVKYAIELGWDIPLPSSTSSISDTITTSSDLTGVPAVDFIKRLQSMFCTQMDKADSNLLEAAHHHPLHGTLIALRYVFGSLDYQSALLAQHKALLQQVHESMFEMVERASSIAMGVLSNTSTDGNIPASFTEIGESIDAIIATSGADELEASGGPNAQVILSFCWRTVKESCGFLEQVLATVPIQSDTGARGGGGLLKTTTLEQAGALFRRLLTTLRHPGAFSAVFPAYIALCTRLLNSSAPELSNLPRLWLEENLDAILNEGISVTRRGAGLPLCILAIVNSELVDQRRTLLPIVMRRVMVIAREPIHPEANQQVDLPQVNAMNVLRKLFVDAKLNTAVLPYVGQGLELAIGAFSSPSWAVRNVGVMMFSTLLQRVFGAKRVRDEHQAMNGIASRELFSRFNGLRGFLLGQLEIAVNQLLDKDLHGSSQTGDRRDRVHPGLYPVLTLLSRLQPSLHADPADTLEGGMRDFITLVRQCAASVIWKTREMAARALVPLVPSRDLMDLVEEILKTCVTDEEGAALGGAAKQSSNELHGLLVQIQFLLRGHLLADGVADRVVRRQFVSRFAPLFEPVAERVLRTGCPLNQYMVLSILTEFVIGQEWQGSPTLDDSERDVEMLSEQEEIRLASNEAFASLRQFAFEACLAGVTEYSDKYRQVIGGHLVQRLMVRLIITHCVLSDQTILNPGQATERAVQFLTADDYEIRLEALETIQAMLQSHKAEAEVHLDLIKIHQTLISILFHGEHNLECLRVQVALLPILNATSPFPRPAPVDMVEFWSRLFSRMDDQATVDVAMVETILPAIGNVFCQIWNDQSLELSVRLECLKRWAAACLKYSDESQTLQLREAVMESLAFFAAQLLRPTQSIVPQDDAVPAELMLFSTLIRLLQDDDVDVRDEMAMVVSKALGLDFGVIAERVLVLLYDKLVERFASGQGTILSEARVQMLTQLLVEDLLGIGKPERIVFESLQPSKVLFDKESPNIHREPLVSMQLALKSLRKVMALESEGVLPASILEGLQSCQEEVTRQIGKVQAVLDDWSVSEDGRRELAPWGVTGRKVVFEVLWKLASGGGLTPMVPSQANVGKAYVHDAERVHPAIVAASQWMEGETAVSTRDVMFLVE